MIDPSSFWAGAGLEEAERHFAVVPRRDEGIERGIVGELEAEIVINDGFVLGFKRDSWTVVEGAIVNIPRLIVLLFDFSQLYLFLK